MNISTTWNHDLTQPAKIALYGFQKLTAFRRVTSSNYRNSALKGSQRKIFGNGVTKHYAAKLDATHRVMMANGGGSRI